MRVRGMVEMRVVTDRTFWRHYLEMVLVMMVGMGVLAMPVGALADAAAPVWPAAGGDGPVATLVRMAVAMTVPMVPWMRWRGHVWRPTVEMVGAMVVPTAGVVALAVVGIVASVDSLMVVEHTAMFAGMFAVMAARSDDYAGAHQHRARLDIDGGLEEGAGPLGGTRDRDDHRHPPASLEHRLHLGGPGRAVPHADR
jgi:hypothetical protein